MYYPEISYTSIKIYFVDKETYGALADGPRRVPLGDFGSMLEDGIKLKDKLSVSAAEQVKYTNSKINKAVFGCYDYPSVGLNSSISKDELSYIETQVDTYLETENPFDSLFYEILPVNDKECLVVVGSGFLHHLAQSKDNLTAFILACLSLLNSLKCDHPPLNRLYLSLKYIEGYHLLVKARIQS